MASEIIAPVASKAALALASEHGGQSLNQCGATSQRNIRQFLGPKWQQAWQIAAAAVGGLREGALRLR
jgi:hypothetical protein